MRMGMQDMLLQVLLRIAAYASSTDTSTGLRSTSELLRHTKQATNCRAAGTAPSQRAGDLATRLHA